MTRETMQAEELAREFSAGRWLVALLLGLLGAVLVLGGLVAFFYRKAHASPESAATTKAVEELRAELKAFAAEAKTERGQVDAGVKTLAAALAALAAAEGGRREWFSKKFRELREALHGRDK